MNSQSEATLNIQDVPRLISKYWPSMILSTFVGAALFFTIAQHMPKKYKAHFVLTIYSKYFESPLVGDFVPELSESGEMRSQRESLIRQVLTPDYLDALGKKYGIYSSSQYNPSPWYQILGQSLGLMQPLSKDSQLSTDRENLRARIEIFPVNSTTFNVGFLYSDPAVTLQVTQDLYGEIIQSLLEIRQRVLGNVHDAIQNRLATLSVNTPAVAPAPGPTLPTGAQMVEEELASVRSQIETLTSQYTEEHPLVIQLREREKLLVSRLAGLEAAGLIGSPSTPRRAKTPVNGGSGETTRDIYGDLSKKLNYLNIAIESDKRHENDYFAVLETPLYPSAPLWPKKGLFALWGMALGLFGSLFVAAIREYYDRSAFHASSIAQHLNLPLLGELPAFPSRTTDRVSTSEPH